jgi:hypothetical protein
VKRLLPALLALALLGCPAGPPPGQTGPVELQVTGPYVHKKTQMVFPEMIGNIHRTHVTRFDAAENDVGLTYSGNNLPLVISVFVYPAPRNIAILPAPGAAEAARTTLFLNHYAQLKSEVTNYNKTAAMVSDRDFDFHQGTENHSGKEAVFKLNYRFSLGEQPSSSLLYLFQTGEWLISYRITYPESFAKEFQPIVQELMQSIKFPAG